jgi:glycosyltransferase involved in cell wall biosynthesis
MLEGARFFVVVPAFNEEKLVGATLTGIPSIVDEIIVVDDASRDRTAEVARSSADPRVRVVTHEKNRGVGAAIATGYRLALRAGAGAVAVMGGDAQMHPDDLLPLALPVVRGEVDYAKGNRLGHADARRMPLARRAAGHVLSRMTGWAAGIELMDSQCGYTVIGRRALERIDLDALYPSYGYPNDLLGRLVLAGCSTRDVLVRPVYAGEASGIRPWHLAVIVGLIARTAWWRVSSRRAIDANPTSCPVEAGDKTDVASPELTSTLESGLPTSAGDDFLRVAEGVLEVERVGDVPGRK